MTKYMTKYAEGSPSGIRVRRAADLGRSHGASLEDLQGPDRLPRNRGSFIRPIPPIREL